jgi:hypothetical protein
MGPVEIIPQARAATMGIMDEKEASWYWGYPPTGVGRLGEESSLEDKRSKAYADFADYADLVG